jgi:hypothetical protein
LDNSLISSVTSGELFYESNIINCNFDWLNPGGDPPSGICTGDLKVLIPKLNSKNETRYYFKFTKYLEIKHRFN